MNELPPGSGAQLRLVLAATGWAACLTVWFLVMGGIALWSDDQLLGGLALGTVFLGGLALLFALSRGSSN